MTTLHASIALFIIATMLAFVLGFWSGQKFPDCGGPVEAQTAEASASQFHRLPVVLRSETAGTVNGAAQIDPVLVADTDVGKIVVKLADLTAVLSVERPVIFDERSMAYKIGRNEMKRLRKSIETGKYHLEFMKGQVDGPVTAHV